MTHGPAEVNARSFAALPRTSQAPPDAVIIVVEPTDEMTALHRRLAVPEGTSSVRLVFDTARFTNNVATLGAGQFSSDADPRLHGDTMVPVPSACLSTANRWPT